LHGGARYEWCAGPDCQQALRSALDCALRPEAFSNDLQCSAVTGVDRNGRRKNPMNASETIDQLIAGITDWRGKTLAGVRKAILEADPEIIEEWKWMGSPVWSRDGMIAVGNAHKDKVKLTFAHGAQLADPDKLFNAGLEGNARRAIDFFEGDKVNARALKSLVRAAIEYNQTKLKKNAKAPAKASTKVSKGKVA
jgi:hypothetical protein